MDTQPADTFDVEFATRLARESWSLYGVAMFIYALRVYTKCRFSGWRNFTPDDYLSLVAVGLYTGLIVCLNAIATGGGSNLYEPGEYETFTPDQIEERIFGSKIVVVSEQCMLCVIYCLKSCILILHHRLTQGVAHQKNVRILSMVVAAGFLSSEIAFFTACRPFSGYWALPPPSAECSTLFTYAVVVGTFNISTDIVMLALAAVLVARLHVPLKQKLLVGIIFSMGIFVVVAALLTKIFNLTDPFSPSYMNWYTREASIAMYVTNLIPVWPLLRHIFPCLRPIIRTKQSGSRAHGAGMSFGISQGRRTGNTTVIETKDRNDSNAAKHGLPRPGAIEMHKMDGIAVVTQVDIGIDIEEVPFARDRMASISEDV